LFLDFMCGPRPPAEEWPRLWAERPCGFGEPRETRQAVEESGAQLVFELMDLLRKRGLGDVLIFGRPGEISGSGDCAKYRN